ncbi:AEC family transporter [Oceanisphaera psychrotolerans]|uniref:Transporter n=1 Tax=Oceanisphaera psychrotolerans TaxID=1414654 RepID=A0A1J4QBF4_9GAMM|nr:AEC family transporter [Oceanisphaera psychrotolerans]OIN06770.1 transporter [Oceanisphaera psychrotolerans]
MNQLINSVLFSVSITGPICLLLLLGIGLRRTQMMNEGFIDSASKLVFNIALPMLLFTSIAQSDFSQMASPALILYGVAATLVVFVLLEWLAIRMTTDIRVRGILVQGAFRANMGIVGLAYVNNAYGSQGVAAAAMYVVCLTILFNILAIITLNRSLNQGENLTSGKLLKGIVKNPLIIGIVAALPFAASDWAVPDMLMKTGQYLAQMTLPLALLCTGASLSLKSGKEESGLLPVVALLRLLIIPTFITLGGYLVGFRDTELAILFLINASPTAAASYVMVRAMGGNAVLAANIIAVTTLGSLLSTSLGAALLKGLGWF